MANKRPGELPQVTGAQLTDAAVLLVQLEGEQTLSAISYAELRDRLLADLGPVVTPE